MTGSIIKALQKAAHTVLPNGVSPQFTRKLIGAIYKRLIFDSETQTVTIQTGLLAGLRIFGPFNEYSFDLALGKYEPEVTAVIMEICRKDMTAFDIGANLGFHTLLFSKLVGKDGKVYAFEPMPETSKWLKETIKNNGIGNVSVHQVAISNKSGEGLMKSQDAVDRCATLSQEKGASCYTTGNSKSLAKKCECVTVLTITLDEFCICENIKGMDLIKIDVEGAEMVVLEGLENIKYHKVRPVLIIEIWGEEHLKRAPELLRQWGYDVKTLDEWKGYVAGALSMYANILATPVKGS